MNNRLGLDGSREVTVEGGGDKELNIKGNTIFSATISCFTNYVIGRVLILGITKSSKYLSKDKKTKVISIQPYIKSVEEARSCSSWQYLRSPKHDNNT